MHREALLLDDAEQLATLAAPRSGAGCAAPSRRQLTLLGVLAALAAIGLTVNSITQRRNRANVRGPFGARKRANLIFEQDFRTAHTLDPEVWNVARTLSDDPHQSFQYYTDDSSVLYVNNTDGTLRIVPGLFSTMGPLETVAGHPPFLAEDVMRGSCSPYPACATFKVPGCTDDPATGGCEATGGAWSSLGPTVVKPTTSAKLDTKGKFEFTYGRLEIRLRLPAGDWLWPSFWLLPATNAYGAAWPLSGQIDLVESRGNGPAFALNGQPAGRDVATSTFHYGENWFWHATGSARAPAAETAPAPAAPGGIGASASSAANSFGGFAGGFHTFGLFWNETSMYTYVLLETGAAGGASGGGGPAGAAASGGSGGKRAAKGESGESGSVEELRIVDLSDRMAGGFFDGPLGLRGPPAPSFRDARVLKPLPEAAPSPYKRSGAANAPFDRPFYLNLKVAVGDMLFGCPDPQYFGTSSIWCKPCAHPAPQPGAGAPAASACGPPQTQFWTRKSEWLPSWEKARQADRLGLAVQWIRVYQ